MAKQGKLRVIFLQEIIRKSDKKMMVSARITAVLTKNNRPISSDIFVEKMVDAGIKVEEV
jgi:acyl-CoA thioester hydrolase